MSKKYDEYLNTHIHAVGKAAEWMVHHLSVFQTMDLRELITFGSNVLKHDASKYEKEEYDPYDAYFYGDRDDNEFNYAWLHHIHNNPHHWQHWLLVNDGGNIGDQSKLIALEMPKVHALEMVADWWSFSWRSGNLFEVFGWYENHRDNIILHPDTRAFVESVLNEMREKLAEEGK